MKRKRTHRFIGRDPLRLIPVIFLTLFLGCGHSLKAQIIRIPGDRPTIQEGIGAAETGDTVLISEGTYFEHINFHGKAITVASHFIMDGDTSHIFHTIINGSQFTNPDTASVVTMWSGEDTTSILAGLTITGGNGTVVDGIHHGSNEIMNSMKYRAGGGILIYNSGGKVIHNIIEENHLVAGSEVRGPLGAGIFAAVNNHHSAIFHNNIIRNNSGSGNDAFCAGAALFGGKFLFEHNDVRNNTLNALDLSSGAGILLYYEFQEGTIEEAIIRNNIITGNKTYSKPSYAFGGGITVNQAYENGQVQISNNIISDNYCEGKGGAISCWSSNVNISENLIFDNVATIVENVIFLDEWNEIMRSMNLSWSGKLWLATRSGLVRIHTGTGKLSGSFGKNGLQSEPFSRQFHIDPQTGELNTGEKANAINFGPENVFLNTFDPPAILVDFRKFPESGSRLRPDSRKRSRNANHRLDLTYHETFLQFKFDAIRYPGSNENQYKYFFKGVDKDTVFKGRAYLAIYRDLKPGKYKFWATYAHQDDPFNPDPVTLDIHIKPPWYGSNLAVGSYIVFFILVVTGMIRIRTARLRKEKHLLEAEVAKRTAELSEKNRQILEMEQMKTRFFTDISHEIRTPLSLISGPLENLLQQDHPAPETDRWLHMIRRNSRRLLQLVNQLLDISKLDSGHMKLVLGEADIIKHLRVLANEFLSLAESRNIQFVVDIPDVQAVVWYDGEKIEKIMTNLLSNAFKYTPEKGTVTCRIKILDIPGNHYGQLLRMLVADTGPGIPQEEREKIFKRFYRSEGELFEDAGGTGIGLSLTREMINLLKGEIIVKSLEGRGSVFVVTLPLGRDHLEESDYILKKPGEEPLKSLIPDEDLRETVEEGSADHTIEILVVEDNKDLRSFIRENLSPEFQVSEAENGTSGLKIAQSKLPDLIISDIMMSGMDGIEFCRMLKEDERTSHIPVIMLTAKSTKEDRIEGLKQGADDYILKPFSMDELKVRISNLLEQREKLKRKYSGMIGLDWGKLSVTTLDEQFLKKVTETISEQLQDLDFNVRTLQEKMSMSREHLSRKLKALTGESPSSLIWTMRLKTAASLLEKGEKNITRVALDSGYSNSSSFAQSFKNYFGKTPREYQKDFTRSKYR